MVNFTLSHGMDTDGGLFDEGHEEGGIAVPNKVWWVQAEARCRQRERMADYGRREVSRFRTEELGIHQSRNHQRPGGRVVCKR